MGKQTMPVQTMTYSSEMVQIKMIMSAVLEAKLYRFISELHH